MKTNGKTNPFKVADAIDAISYIYEFQYLIGRSPFRTKCKQNIDIHLIGSNKHKH